MADLEYKTTPVAVDARGTFAGWAAVYGNVDDGGDEIQPGAVSNLDEFKRKGYILHNHDAGKPPVGTLTHVEDSRDGLWIEGKFSQNDFAQSLRRAYVERQEAGQQPGEFSIGYRAVKHDYDRRRGCRLLQKIAIHEISLLSGVPAMNNRAALVSVKGGSMSALKVAEWRERYAQAQSPGEMITSHRDFVGVHTKSVSISVKADGLVDPIAASLRLTVPPAPASDPAFGMLPYVRRETLPAGIYLITYYRVSPVSGAQTVARGNLKPVLELITTRVDATAQTIAAALIVTRAALADTPTVETLVNDSLRAALRLELADQVLNGTGTPPDLTGVMTDASVTQTASGDLATSVIKGATILRSQGIRPVVAVANPNDASAYLQAKTTHYDVALGVETIAGVPLAYEAAMPAGKGLVLGEGAITLWTKGEGRIIVGTQGSQLIENKQTIVADLEALLAINRPSAIVKLTVTAPV